METPKIPTPHDKQDGDEALSFDPTTPPAQVDIHGFARRAGEIMARGGVLCWGDASDEDRKQTPCAENRPPARQLRELRSLRCVFAIARAKTWMQGLRHGKYGDTVEIARRFKLNDAHVRRVLRFGYLAPDIVEAIVEGRQPRSLTVRRLLQGIPCAWADQRTALGFTPGQ